MAKIYYLPAKVMWLEKTLADIQVMFDGISYEVTGIILVDPEAKLTEVTRREALTVLMTRFLRLVEELEKKEVLMDKLPEIVIGDVGGRYSAQVTLKLGHLSTEASVTAIDTGWLPEPPKAPFPTWNPLKPNAYLVDEVPEANWPKPGWKKKIA